MTLGDGDFIGQRAGGSIESGLSEIARGLSYVADKYTAENGLTKLGDSFEEGCKEIRAGLEILAAAIENMSQ